MLKEGKKMGGGRGGKNGWNSTTLDEILNKPLAPLEVVVVEGSSLASLVYNIVVSPASAIGLQI